MALSDNLIEIWKLDEASGGALATIDSGNNLTDNNSVGADTGKISGARSFSNASSKYLSCASNASLQTGNIDFTLAAWINPSVVPPASDRIIAAKGQTNWMEYEWVIETKRATFYAYYDDVGGGSSVKANNFGDLSVDTWYFVVAWHDSVNNIIGISVNGTSNTLSYSSGCTAGNSDFRIGAGNNSGVFAPFDGLIDELAFWKRVLTSDEQTQLYNGGSGLAYELWDVTATPDAPQFGGQPVHRRSRVAGY